MAVRKTESRVPGGFAAVAALGEAVTGADGNVALVGQLAAPLRSEPGVLSIRNRYVVFVNTAAAAEPADYEWSFEFFTDDPATPFHATPPRITDIGTCFLDADEIPELHGADITKVAASVAVAGVPEPLTLVQPVTALHGDVEALFDGGAAESIARGGTPSISRAVANLYRAYILATAPADDDAGLPVNLTAALLYLHLLRLPHELARNDLDAWESYVNEDRSEEDVPAVPLGITQVRPHVLSMFVGAGGEGPGATVLVPWDPAVEPYARYQDRIIENFHALDRDTKTDLVNLLRFPESALRVGRALLDGCLARHEAWRELERDELIEERDAIETIVSEYEVGPFDGATETTAVARATFGKMFTPYIQAIVASSLIQYEIVKVLVLDVRSGRPVAGARVRKLVIRSGAHEIVAEFAHDSAPTNPSHSTGLQSQFALLYLGYDPAGPSTNYGDVGRARYKEYWDDRVIDGSVEAVASGNPPEHMLELIIAEYNSHRATSDEGILELRIPAILFENRRLSVDVGFWEVPVALEALAGDAVSVRRAEEADGSPRSGVPGFAVEWVGPQELGWEASVTGAGHFGWRVAGGGAHTNFRAAVRLTLKDDELPFDGLDASRLSGYYARTGHHYVLFAMQWCQPVWDEFLDSSTAAAGAITENTYVQHSDYRNLRMHLVTQARDLGGSDDYGGKGYGKCENTLTPKWRGDDGHKGLDLHAKIGDDVYAVHGGVASNSVSAVGGNVVTLDWPGPGRTSIQYLHLSAFLVGDPPGAGRSARVLAGTVVGKAGRTGNLYGVSSQPTHVHVNIGAGAADGSDPEKVRLRDEPDDDNKIAIPFNDIPLLFPCKCEVTQNSPEDCGFDDAAFVDGCWAPAELRCPYMSTGNAVFRLQVRLRYLHEEIDEGAYFDPGTIDGALGASAGNLAVGLASGTAVERLTGEANSRHGGKLIKIKHGEKQGWIEASLLDDDEIAVPGGGTLENLATTPVGKSRMAIYLFRKEQDLLDYDDYASNFAIDGALAELEALTPIEPWS